MPEKTAPSLVGNKVYLRPITEDDVPLLNTWYLQSDPQSLSSFPIDISSAVITPDKAPRKNTVQGQQQRFAVVHKKEDELVGYVSYSNYNPLNCSAELWVLIAPGKRRKNYAEDAIEVMCQYLFYHRGVHKVYAETAAYNKGAIKLLKKLRFKQDAVLRNHYYHDCEFHHGYIYSLLFSEFK